MNKVKLKNMVKMGSCFFCEFINQAVYQAA
jgi:hypothetical protein